MNLDDVVQHIPLVLYLLVVSGLSINLLPPARTRSSLLFLVLAIAALGTTWTYMIKFLLASYAVAKSQNATRDYYSTTIWLKETSLFKQAWEYVCTGTERWWLSSQLCTFTVGLWTVFLVAEGSRRSDLQKRAWQYMLLGQIVAISFASSLFLSLMASKPSFVVESTSRSNSKGSSQSSAAPLATTGISAPSTLLVASVALSLITVFIVPATTGTSLFLPNLLFMHAIILLPLLQVAYATPLSKDKPTETTSKVTFQNLYLTVAALSLAIHAHNTYPLFTKHSSFEDFGNTLWQQWNSFPSQQSISWDIACTNGIWQLWSMKEFFRLVGSSQTGKYRSTTEIGLALLGIFAVPSLGSAVGISLFLAVRQSWLLDQKTAIKVE